MTKKDFFVLIIKLFGLYMLVNSLFNWITFNFSFAIRDLDLFSIVWMLIATLIMVGLFVLLIFKSSNVVNLLKLDKHFDDDRIDLGKFDPSSIIKLALIVIGGLLIIDNIPNCLSQILFAFKVNVHGFGAESGDKFNLIVSGIKLVFGFLIMTNYSGITKLLKLKGKTN
ncbi:hypothetical protein [Ancylomarina sp. 16SWW S1-10-2]|uniref:hypothetical protein n=1 Tax=Ancylomarina sp. 16SWW S1-10-2 TaxID=2499681 RepID=UPI0012AE52DD|nr:hypothetical protein [Ancylomarina sp. 16SWW S1-10-2]MRT94579.1 hypothetical protein [Ancylomarina sp. 16SWW S1-10-2]